MCSSMLFSYASFFVLCVPASVVRTYTCISRSYCYYSFPCSYCLFSLANKTMYIPPIAIASVPACFYISFTSFTKQHQPTFPAMLQSVPANNKNSDHNMAVAVPGVPLGYVVTLFFSFHMFSLTAGTAKRSHMQPFHVYSTLQNFAFLALPTRIPSFFVLSFLLLSSVVESRNPLHILTIAKHLTFPLQPPSPALPSLTPFPPFLS